MPETQPGSRKSQPRNQSPGGEADSVLGDPRALVEAFRSPRTGRRRGPGRGLSAAAATGRPSAQRRWRGGGRRADLGTPAARRPGYRPAAPGARRPSYRPAPPGLAGPVTDPHPWGSQAQLQTRSPRGSQARLQTRSPRGSQARLQTRSPLGLAGQVTDPQPPGLPGAVTDPQPPGLPGAVTDPQPPGLPGAVTDPQPPGLPGAVTDPQPPGAPRRGYRPAAPGAPGAVTDPQPPPPQARRPSYRPAAPRGSQAQLQTRSPRGSQAGYRPAAPGAPRPLQPAAPPQPPYRPAPSWSQAGYRPAPPSPGLAGAVTDPQPPSGRRRGYRPAPPRPAPAPGPRARLSVSSVPPYGTARLHFRARRSGIDPGGGRGAREQVAAAGSAGPPARAPGRPSRRLCRQRFRGGRSSPRSARAAGRTLRRVGRCCCCWGCGAAGLRGCGAAGLRGRARGRRRGAGGEGRPGPRLNMAEVTIDQSKLPGVKEVCRDFAVLEDHTLAHSLQEQEIEHHLASNIQRNRLVQHDLQVAKQLQEEDLKAQAQLQKRYKDLEQQDCEIAQEIQEKLAIEAERRRIQEKKDEDIARLLQEKELQEEKKRKKHFPESSGSSAYGDSCYYENGDQPQSRRARELGSGVSRSCRLQSDGNIVKQRNKKLKHPVENLEELEDHCSSGKFLSSRSLGTLRANPQIDIEQRERKRSDHERRRRPPLPKISGEVFLSTGFDDGEAHSSHRTWNWEKQSRHQDRLSPKSSQKAGLHCKEAVYGRDNGQGEHRERKHRPRTPPFPGSEEQLQLHDTGMKPRMMKEADSAPSRVAHRDQEWYDAEIARKLQEEEILATQVDMRAAQVAQDEEIARLLMAEEKKAYKKAKEREKSSLDKRKHDSDWKPKTTKSAHSKSKESNDPHRSKNDRPARPPPPTMTEAEDLDYTHFTNQHNSTRHFSKSESSHKGFHHKQ
uniref:Coiled-coil domain-containing protein n=2 Tax=Canis lupus TaxID=9612 RepID=A0A8C0T8G5_CANLF